MIELFTAATPNGRKVSVLLEELNLDYQVNYIDLYEKEQKQDWYLKLNPNGRIPVIVDHERDNFAVFESGAILIYLAEKYEAFLPTDPLKRSQAIQWLMFQMGGLGPMQGQANVFYRYAEEKIPYAIQRYQNETARLYGVLETQLRDKEFLAGEYSIADMAAFPWVDTHNWAGVDITPFPNLQNWLKRLWERPAVKRGMDVPKTYERPDEVAEDSEKLAAKTGRGILQE